MSDESGGNAGGPRIGGDRTKSRYAFLFLWGVLVGSAIRTVAWLVPSGLRGRVKDRLP